MVATAGGWSCGGARLVVWRRGESDEPRVGRMVNGRGARSLWEVPVLVLLGSTNIQGLIMGSTKYLIATYAGPQYIHWIYIRGDSHITIRDSVGLIFQGAPSHQPSRPLTILIPPLGLLDRPLTGLALKLGLGPSQS